MIAASQAEEDARNRLSREEMIDNICTIFFGAYEAPLDFQGDFECVCFFFLLKVRYSDALIGS